MMGLKSRDDFLAPFFAVCCDEPVAETSGLNIFMYYSSDGIANYIPTPSLWFGPIRLLWQ